MPRLPVNEFTPVPPAITEPNEPVEVDEPLTNSILPVLKFVILVEKLPESVFKSVTLVEKLELGCTKLPLISEASWAEELTVLVGIVTPPASNDVTLVLNDALGCTKLPLISAES